ncbi:NAD(P)H oxidoreductase [Streptomyces sp. ISL-100]|uniref:NAD(P)H oxidoreductase n=1 Tax=Streptomyces sp. ISL-100 TaxID=2819173 RepID=UPI001BE9A55B|nr:NAD(P)H oxidoreductase [Streptomyces sp. ISL-100]MBT2401363.1 NAD(P)H oxidoreductase [Streptomyces sp. ISL-100]
MSKHALLVVAHPRPDSLTAQLAERARARLAADGYSVDVLDLHAEDFDPRMSPADEPDWADLDKEYSAEVRAHMRRVWAADTIVVVFPLWWFGLPAILKGWIDRVWNNGFAYGQRAPRLRGKRMLWLALAAYGEEQFVERGWNELVGRLLRVGISEYCGIEDAQVHFVYDSLGAGADVLKEADVALDAVGA